MRQQRALAVDQHKSNPLTPSRLFGKAVQPVDIHAGEHHTGVLAPVGTESECRGKNGPATEPSDNVIADDEIAGCERVMEILPAAHVQVVSGGIIGTRDAAIRPGCPQIGQTRLKPDYIGKNLVADARFVISDRWYGSQDAQEITDV